MAAVFGRAETASQNSPASLSFSPVAIGLEAKSRVHLVERPRISDLRSALMGATSRWMRGWPVTTMRPASTPQLANVARSDSPQQQTTSANRGVYRRFATPCTSVIVGTLLTRAAIMRGATRWLRSNSVRTVAGLTISNSRSYAGTCGVGEAVQASNSGMKPYGNRRSFRKALKVLSHSATPGKYALRHSL